MGIQSPGIGSGLDISGIVSSLISAEQAPAEARFNRNESTYQSKLSALGLLKSSLSSFQDSLSSLTDITSFQKRTTSSSDYTLVTATADETAIEGSYSVEVNRLAQTHKMGSADHLDTDTFGGTAGDELTVTVGTDTLTIDLSTAMTLDELNSAINDAAEADGVGVSSTVISGDGGIQKLTLTSNSSGYDNRVQIGGLIDVLGTPTASDTVFGLTTINTDPDGNPLGADTELDSEIVVDGLTLTRASNSITDVITGVSIELIDVTTAPETLSVSLNKASVKKSVKDFVESYNSLMTTMDELSAFDPVTKSRSVLLGDATLRAVEFALRNELSSTVSGVTGAFDSLSSLGITTERDGSITLDTDILDDAVDNNFDDIGQLFASEDGVANRFNTLVDAYVSSSGIIDARVDGINTSIEDITDQREALARRLATLEQRYLSQFTAMDLMISQLQATSTYLTGAFEALPGSTFKKK
ncbi:MAG: flagellar filament capping protein FliD [Gammaproteobacteria bacterium]|nr:flagellar filament capping protein FliD [Gammaproteobacteria bacterium]